tara:strand:- start:418 stop:1479 length:1062 start_codon:yes stop_codon:yes gene_type:complete
MKKILTEWRDYLSEQGLGPEEDIEPVTTMVDPARKKKDFTKDPRWKSGEKELQKLEKDIEKKEKSLRNDIKLIPRGMTLPGQPAVTRITDHTPIGTPVGMRNAIGGTTPIDEVLKWLIFTMKYHATLAGVTGEASKYLLPNGAKSGFRTEEQQTQMFLKRLTKDLIKIRQLRRGQVYKKGIIKVLRLREPAGRTHYAYSDGKMQAAYGRLPSWTRRISLNSPLTLEQAKLLKRSAPYKTAKQEVARPVALGGKPNHLSGRTVDFALPGNDWSLTSGNKSAVKSTKIGRFLFAYAPMYGLANYSREVWHWELNNANYSYFKKMKEAGTTPIDMALSVIGLRKSLEKPREVAALS